MLRFRKEGLLDLSIGKKQMYREKVDEHLCPRRRAFKEGCEKRRFLYSKTKICSDQAASLTLP